MSTKPAQPSAQRPSSAPVIAIAAAAAGLVFGWVGGGIGPRRELSAVQAELDRAQDSLIKAQRGAARRGFGGDLIPGMGAFLGAPSPGGAAPQDDGAPGEPAPEGPTSAATGAGAAGGPQAVAPTPSTADELQTGFNQAAELQAARAAQTRTALAEQAELSAAEQSEVDALVGRLEARLAEQADAMLALAISTEEPPTAEALRLSHEVTGALYEAQSGLEDLIGADRIEGVDPEAMQIWNLVELDAMRPAVERAAADLAAADEP